MAYVDLTSEEDYALILPPDFVWDEPVLPKKRVEGKDLDDDDAALALVLQLEEEEKERKRSKRDNSVDAHADTNDLNIQQLFVHFDQLYFKSSLGSVFVEWSKKMTLCAGICSYEGRGGVCAIRLSEPLLKFRSRSDMVDTLLHEMIHAYLFVTANNKDHNAHGEEFQKLMHKINSVAGTRITIYHNFTEEVDYYRTHWWMCDGPCKHKPPYFGIVKRAMNRPPGPKDQWWATHQSECGGTYTKIKEPPEYTQKKRKLEEKEEKATKKQKTGNKSILNFFKDKGNDKDKDNTSPDDNPATNDDVTITTTTSLPKTEESDSDDDFVKIRLTKKPKRTDESATATSSTATTTSTTTSSSTTSTPTTTPKSTPKTEPNPTHSTAISSSKTITPNSTPTTTPKSTPKTTPTSTPNFTPKSTPTSTPQPPKSTNTPATPSTVACPVCGEKLPESEINTHLDACLE